MKIILFKNKKDASRVDVKSIELFGLSRSGKTTLLERLIKKKGKKVFIYNTSQFNKYLLFSKHFIKNPIKTTYLFYKLNTNWIILPNLAIRDYFGIFLLRNSYLGAVLSKYEIAKKFKDSFVVDEFLMQSVLMILHKKSTNVEISKVMSRLPKSNEILLVESTPQTRYKRIKNTRFPGEQISKEYSIAWMKNSEFNYQIMKDLLLKDYGPIEKNPKL